MAPAWPFNTGFTVHKYTYYVTESLRGAGKVLSKIPYYIACT